MLLLLLCLGYLASSVTMVTSLLVGPPLWGGALEAGLQHSRYIIILSFIYIMTSFFSKLQTAALI